MPTILEMSRDEWLPYAQALSREKPRQLTPEEIAQRNELIERARQAAEMLRQKYGARRVILFGSLAHQAWFDPETDVDIAAEGLEDDYFRAWSDVEQFFPDRKLDLIDWAMATEALRNAIERKGIEI